MQKNYPQKSVREVRNELTKTIQKVVANPNPADVRRLKAMQERITGKDAI